MPPVFSGAVCTRNRCHLLSSVLSDLVHQDADLEFDVTTVGKRSNDDTQALSED